MKLKNNKNIKTGGDGYTINVNQGIGGLPAFARYSSNYRPVFCGDLLQCGDITNTGKITVKNDLILSEDYNQNGGDGYTTLFTPEVGGLPFYKQYTYNNEPVFNGSLLQNGGGCGCNTKSSVYDPSIFELIKQRGGFKKKEEKISQFYAIQKIANTLSPLSSNSLLKLNLELFFKSFSNQKSKSKNKKMNQLGGYTNELASILAPLGKNNLLVLASLLLLHYFAVERVYSKDKVIILSGGDKNFISDTFDSIGLKNIYNDLFHAFHENSKKQVGGNPLKDLIAPLGTNAFIATGLLIILEKLFTNKMNEINSKDEVKKNLIGGKINKKYEELFNLIAPITFNIFAKKSFLDKMISSNNK